MEWARESRNKPMHIVYDKGFISIKQKNNGLLETVNSNA